MNDKERYENLEVCHLYLAIKRKKDNEGKQGKKIFRQIKYGDMSLELIRHKCRLEGGTWRIYQTVNKRDMKKALHNFRHILLDTQKTAIESLWRKELLQVQNRADRFYMLDVDTKDEVKLDAISSIVEGNVIARYDSPNGKHIIIKPMDVRLFSNLDYVTVLKDGYFFVELIESQLYSRKVGKNAK